MPNLFIANKKILIGRSLLGEDNSVQPVAAQGPLLGKISEAEGFEEGVELRDVVGAVVVVADIGMSTKYIFCLFDTNRFVNMQYYS